MPLVGAERKHRVSGEGLEMSVDVAAHLVRIHINREARESPNPTTGEALYLLAEVSKHEKLFREVVGDKEDELLVRDDTSVHLIADEHFYTQKGFLISVNGDDHEIDTNDISYTRVVELYLGSGGDSSNQYLVKYSQGPIENQNGVLTPGQKVRVKDGMRFRVAGTGES
jgi:hypothetical protein